MVYFQNSYFVNLLAYVVLLVFCRIRTFLVQEEKKTAQGLDLKINKVLNNRSPERSTMHRRKLK